MGETLELASLDIVKKQCTRCKQHLPLDDFSRNRGGMLKKHSVCKKCRAITDEIWRKQNPEKTKATQKKWRNTHKEYNQTRRKKYWRANLGLQRLYMLKHRYSLTTVEWHTLYQKQRGCCAICGKFFADSKGLDTDHCHTTQQVRGLLCRRCNYGIGFFGDNIEILHKAIEYLRGSSKNE